MEKTIAEQEQGKPDLHALLVATRKGGSRSSGRLLAVALFFSIALHTFAAICLPPPIPTVKVLRVALLIDGGEVAVKVERSDAMSASPAAAFRPASPKEVQEKRVSPPKQENTLPDRLFGNIPADFAAPEESSSLATPERKTETREAIPLERRRNGFGRADKPVPAEATGLFPAFRESIPALETARMPDGVQSPDLPETEFSAMATEFFPAIRERGIAPETPSARIGAVPVPAEFASTPERKTETREAVPLERRRNGFGRADKPVPAEATGLCPAGRESMPARAALEIPEAIRSPDLPEIELSAVETEFLPAIRDRETAPETPPARLGAILVPAESAPAAERKTETREAVPLERRRNGFGRADKPFPPVTVGFSPAARKSVPVPAAAHLSKTVLYRHEERFLLAEAGDFSAGPAFSPPTGREESAPESLPVPTDALPVRMRRHENDRSGRAEAPARRNAREREAPNPETRTPPETRIPPPSPASPSLAGGDRREFGAEERPNSVNGFVIPYPDISRRRGESGMVLVRAVIDVRGRCLSAAIARSSGSRGLDRAAVEGVRKAAYRPARRGGIAVTAEEDFLIEFHLR
ncbi:MAG: TonB family protein [Planctomycetota bacterium]|jgi:protein TonB|nr:TonB family protein [Planctomycetota bacterium]